MNITVYLGANEGNDTTLKDAVRKLGTWIGESGNRLIYGGSKSGLMGVLAQSVTAAGGEAIGVEPKFFVEQVLQFEGLTQLIVTRDMSERKAKMIELGDAFIALPGGTETMSERKAKMIELGEAFIALPGGTGTLEEISEIMSKISMKHLNAPCIIYNHNGFYNGLKVLLDKMTEQGLSSKERQNGIRFADSVEEIIKLLS